MKSDSDFGGENESREPVLETTDQTHDSLHYGNENQPSKCNAQFDPRNYSAPIDSGGVFFNQSRVFSIEIPINGLSVHRVIWNYYSKCYSSKLSSLS